MKLLTQIDTSDGNIAGRSYYLPDSQDELVTDVIKTLPIHFKLILYACFKLHQQQKKKITVADVFSNYQTLTNELDISYLTMKQVIDKIQQFDMLGLLKCKYVRKGSGQIKYIDVKQPTEISRYISVLKEEIEKIKPEEIEMLKSLDKQRAV
jgi:Cdc6-like AAA superfamily ATPase